MKAMKGINDKNEKKKGFFLCLRLNVINIFKVFTRNLERYGRSNWHFELLPVERCNT